MLNVNQFIKLSDHIKLWAIMPTLPIKTEVILDGPWAAKTEICLVRGEIQKGMIIQYGGGNFYLCVESKIDKRKKIPQTARFVFMTIDDAVNTIEATL